MKKLPNGRYLKDWVNGFYEYMDYSETADRYIRWAAIATIASAVRRNVWVPTVPLGDIFLNMWIILCGPPGQTRKSDSIKLARRMLKNIPGFYRVPDSVTGAKFISEMHEAMVGAMPITGAPTYPGEMTDKEAMAEVQTAVSIISPEFGVFISNADDRMFSDLTDLFDGADEWARGTKQDGRQTLQNVLLNIFGASTPVSMSKLADGFVTGSGFSSRLMLVCAEKKRKSVSLFAPRNENKMLYEALEHDLREMAMRRGAICVDEPAAAWFEKWYHKHENDLVQDSLQLMGYSARRTTYLVKTAGILAISRGAQHIETQDFERAFSFILEAESVMLQAFSGAVGNPLHQDMKRIKNQIREGRKVRYSTLVRHNARDLPKYKLDEILETLADSHQVRVSVMSGDAPEPVYIWLGE